MKINKEINKEVNKEVSETPIQVDIQTLWIMGSKLTNNIKAITSWMISNGLTKMSDYKYTGEVTAAQLKKLNKSNNGIINIKLNK
tara:strand:+ start:72 stop:326 length:255 start_codon:yes stop_codon:yes gene_type:complete